MEEIFIPYFKDIKEFKTKIDWNNVIGLLEKNITVINNHIDENTVLFIFD